MNRVKRERISDSVPVPVDPDQQDIGSCEVYISKFRGHAGDDPEACIRGGILRIRREFFCMVFQVEGAPVVAEAEREDPVPTAHPEICSVNDLISVAPFQDVG